MKPIEILQGKWLGHPAHPALVHIPLGLWLGACVLDIAIACGARAAVLPQLAYYAVLVGLLGTLVVVPTGIADWASIKRERPAWKLGLYHLLLNAAAAAVWLINFFLRRECLHTGEPVTGLILALSIIGALLLVVSGYLGSLLAFDHGISVARLSKKKWRKLAAEGGANLPEEK